MSEAPVLFETREGVGWITLNRPRVLNALDTGLVVALAEAVERAAADTTLTVVVVRGAGRAFCSGMDRTALGAGAVGEPFFRHWIRALNMLEDMAAVTVAVLHGYSIGGGLQLALACDLRLATADAVVGLGATRHGIIPDGAVLRLARMVGLGRAKELALLNEDVPAAEARALGLVSRVVAPGDVERAVAELIAKTRQASSTANAHVKRLLQASFHRDPRAMIEEVMQAQTDCMASWETAEANRAWRERREAHFYPPPAR
jgi:enoyl-CoA hydratase/carnithine racemase